ncbi:MAG: hypothetical protein J6Z11_13705 [Candidatus Riflebacteria bacterium]|nr:hypothetical protein [Candidatus Riflebacteria bacterium]
MDQNVALTYVRKRKRRKRAAIISGISAIGITIFLIIAFCLIYVDRFTITTVNEPGLCLTIDENKLETCTELAAPPLPKAWNIQYSDIPEDIDEKLGSKNFDGFIDERRISYFAYTFYLKGISDNDELISYKVSLDINKETRESKLFPAIKIMIIRNGERVIYSDKSALELYDGIPGNDSTKVKIDGLQIMPFEDSDYIIVRSYFIKSGEFDRYSVVMWIDGWESSDPMRGGTFNAKLKFSTSIN